LKSLIRAQKNIFPLMNNKNVVYKISCKNCDATYVGQRKRKLNTRISEYKNQLHIETKNKSAIVEYELRQNHRID